MCKTCGGCCRCLLRSILPLFSSLSPYTSHLSLLSAHCLGNLTSCPWHAIFS
uniref:Uncharacterized protein n=1 Tax=Anguilla anguilla TaxID=7936 RepID=A0A0E9TLU8_ANGAN